MSTRRLTSLLVVSAMLTTLIASVPAQANALCTDPSRGCWSEPFSPFGAYDAAPPQTPAESMEYPTAATAVMMPDGRIVYWNGLQGLEDAQAPLAVDAGGVNPRSTPGQLDLTGSSPVFFIDAAPPGPADVHDDLFCTDQRLTSKGSLVAVGGTNWQTEFPLPDEVGNNGGPRGLAELYGSKQQHILTARGATPAEDTVGSSTQWTLGDDMHFARWYPTMITVPSGEHLVAGGVGKLLWNSSALDELDDDDVDHAREPLPYNVPETEIRSKTGAWTLNPESANIAVPLYARMHVLPNGKVFYSGTGQAWGPAGESADQLEWNDLRWLDVTNTSAVTGGQASWEKVGQLTYGFRSGAFSAMLPLQPPYDSAQILVAGGTLGTAPGGYIATNISEKITVEKDGADWTTSVEQTPDLVNRRWYSSGVVLPNGQVVAVNGADADEVVMPGPEAPVRQAELWTGTQWVPLSEGARDRTYHNSAILLPDGSVLIGGHAPINRYYGDKGAPNDEFPGRANNLKDPSFERLFPPYIAAGQTRPKVLSAESRKTWGQNLTITLDPSSIPVDKVVLSRLPSATHTTDADQRSVELTFAQSGTAITAQIPNNRNVLTPGYYYVFALSAQGTPSIATILQVADPVDFDNRPATVQPIDMAPATMRASSGSVVPVEQPAKTAPARAGAEPATPAAPLVVAAPVSAPARQDQSTGWLLAIAALAGVAILRRARLTARARP